MPPPARTPSTRSCGHAAAVKALCALVRDGLESQREVGLLDEGAEIRHPALGGQKHLGRIRRAQQHLPFVANGRLQARIQGKALARQANRRPQAFLQRQFAEAPGQVFEGRGLARNSGRQRPGHRRPCDGIARRVQVHVARGGPGRLFARIEHGLEAVGLPVQQVESAAAETRTGGFDHRQRRRHRDRRIEGVAALRRASPDPPGSPTDRRSQWRPCAHAAAAAAGRVARRRRIVGKRGQRPWGERRQPGGKRHDPARRPSGSQSLRCRFSSISTMRMHEFGHIAAEHRDFADQGRRDEGVLLLRRHEHRLDLGCQMPAHVGQLKLEFEVRHRAQAAHDHRQARWICAKSTVSPA